MTHAEATPFARDLPLDAFEQQAAAHISALLEATGPDGEPLYDELEVRDFIIVCLFELGLPLTFELQTLLNDFIEDEIEIDNPTPTSDELTAAVRAYFAEFPLNPRLVSAFAQLGADEMFRARAGFKTDGARVTRARSAAGTEAALRAPRLAEQKRTAPGPRPRRGLA